MSTLQSTSLVKARHSLIKFSTKKTLSLFRCNWPKICMSFSRRRCQSWWTPCSLHASPSHRKKKSTLLKPNKLRTIFTSTSRRRSWRRMWVDHLRTWPFKMEHSIWVLPFMENQWTSDKVIKLSSMCIRKLITSNACLLHITQCQLVLLSAKRAS